MNRIPAIDMAGALRLVGQGRLREAADVLRGKGDVALPGASPLAPAGYGVPRLMDAVLDQLPADAARLFGRPAQPAGEEIVPGDPNEARFEALHFSNDAGSWTYKLFVPSGRKRQKLPLVVMLHGCTQSPDDFAAGTQMNVLAEEQKFLVAYPEQARTANLSKCWNWYNTANQQRDQGEAAAIAGITRQVMQDFDVAPGRVYAAGLSAGGAAAAILGATYPELYSAIGVHSGLACGAASDLVSALSAMKHGGELPATTSGGAERITPAIVFHGDQDTTVNIANGRQVIAQAMGKAVLRTEIMDGETGGRQYTRTLRSAKDGQPILEEWVLHGAGHAWSGGSKAGSFTDPGGPDASREMIRFFLQLPA